MVGGGRPPGCRPTAVGGGRRHRCRRPGRRGGRRGGAGFGSGFGLAAACAALARALAAAAPAGPGGGVGLLEAEQLRGHAAAHDGEQDAGRPAQQAATGGRGRGHVVTIGTWGPGLKESDRNFTDRRVSPGRPARAGARAPRRAAPSAGSATRASRRTSPRGSAPRRCACRRRRRGCRSVPATNTAGTRTRLSGTRSWRAAARARCMYHCTGVVRNSRTARSTTARSASGIMNPLCRSRFAARGPTGSRESPGSAPSRCGPAWWPRRC